MPSAAEATAWLEARSPWPEEFGLGRMRTVLANLGEPNLAYPAVHVVGTNGKSTAARTVEAHLLAAGLSVGTTLSPHVRSWAERIRVDGEEADLAHAVERVRPVCEDEHATQFEALCAAAFAEFAARDVDVAVVEAGLGGRFDATNVLRTHVVLLTNVGLDHTDVLGGTRAEIAAEKLAVVQPGSVAVLPDDEFAHLAGEHVVVGGAREAAAAFLGRPVEGEVDVALPGRLEWRSEREVWDGAHNPDGIAWLAAHLPRADWTVVASILRDKDAAAIVQGLTPVASRIVVTESSNPRALPAAELASLARAHFADVDEVPDPGQALERARGLGGPVLVTGSLYLLADLARREA
jgi:dihydrofolate synthase/folylpolyglutamate synthase